MNAADVPLIATLVAPVTHAAHYSDRAFAGVYRDGSRDREGAGPQRLFQHPANEVPAEMKRPTFRSYAPQRNLNMHKRSWKRDVQMLGNLHAFFGPANCGISRR